MPGVTEVTGEPMRAAARSGYSSGVTIHRALRRLSTVLVFGLVSVPALVLCTAGAASAGTPEAWDDPPGVSGLEFLLVLFLIPLGLALTISVLAALPNLIGDKGYEPGQSWRSEPEWFGGPRRGLEAADPEAPQAIEGEQGGTSARW